MFAIRLTIHAAHAPGPTAIARAETQRGGMVPAPRPCSPACNRRSSTKRHHGEPPQYVLADIGGEAGAAAHGTSVTGPGRRPKPTGCVELQQPSEVGAVDNLR